MILEWQVLGATAMVVAVLLIAALILLRHERHEFIHKPSPLEVDSLTALPARASLDRELQRLNCPNPGIALLWLDLDHFKQINDSRGHDAGDRTLKEFANLMKQQVRSSDLAARYGGDEFVIVLLNGGSRGAISLASRILEATRHHAFSDGPLTVSIGVAAAPAKADATWDVLMKSADRAMYRAKQAGRNCIKIADSE